VAETNIPGGPIESAPWDAIRAEDIAEAWHARHDAILAGLAGIELGEYDRTIADWLATTWDNPTVAVLCSWLVRVRAAGPPPLGSRLRAIHERHRKMLKQMGNAWPKRAKQIEQDRADLLDEVFRLSREVARVEARLKAGMDEADRWYRMGLASASNYDKGGLAASHAILLKLLDGREPGGEHA
jgi:hypothetical protein